MVDGDETRPHISNQRIAYSSGKKIYALLSSPSFFIVHVGLLAVLSMFVQQFSSTDDTDHLYLLQLAISTIQAITHQNELVSLKYLLSFIFYSCIIGTEKSIPCFFRLFEAKNSRNSSGTSHD